MKRSSIIIIGILLAAGVSMFGTRDMWGKKDNPARPAMVAGTFYPDNPRQLKETVDGLLAEIKPQKPEGAIYAVVAPHAGYDYSARIAAQAYALLKGRRYKRVVVISPSHTEAFPYTSVFTGDAYVTPLGAIPVDKEFAEKLAEKDPSIKLSDKGHGLSMGRAEHALEVQLPFLQESLTNLTIVPVVMGEADYQASRALGAALAGLIVLDGATQEPDTLIVASSDLSHFHPYDEAVSLDRKTLGAIKANDYFSLSQNLSHGVWEACGGAPIMAAMIAAERMGAWGRKILAYANSGDVTGDKKSVVGYGAAVFYREEKPAEAGPMNFSLDDNEKSALLAIAINSVDTAVRGKRTAPLPDALSKQLQTPFGAFVTLRIKGDLRGCIGYVTPDKSLAETVREAAASAAVNDTRFSPVAADEVGKLEYEISVLSPMRRVYDLKDIRLGRDGLVMQRGRRYGLLLPQVPAEFGLDVPQFVQQTAIKAGLSPDAWEDKETDLFAFSAFVFGEK